MSLLAVGVVATLWLSTQATAGTYRLEKLKQHVGGLNHQVATLRSDVAREQSPASLAAKAHQLGMVPAGVPARLEVGEDGKVTVVGTPSKAAPPKQEHSSGDTSEAGDSGAASGHDGHQQAAPPPHGDG